jgi:branched-subunit amino acid transport protein
MSIWLMIFAAGAVTFLTRASFIFLLDRVKMPDWFWRGLRFVPVAVLSAIILPETLTRNGALDLSWRNPQIIAGLLAVLVAWRTRNVLLTILTGMIALVTAQALLGA